MAKATVASLALALEALTTTVAAMQARIDALEVALADARTTSARVAASATQRTARNTRVVPSDAARPLRTSAMEAAREAAMATGRSVVINARVVQPKAEPQIAAPVKLFADELASVTEAVAGDGPMAHADFTVACNWVSFHHKRLTDARIRHAADVERAERIAVLIDGLDEVLEIVTARGHA